MANGYKIDFTTNTVIMNCTFAKKANEYGSDEYNILKGIREDFPQISVVVKKGRDQKKANINKRLTYDNMRSYISVLDNSDEMLSAFEGVIALSATQKSPYKFVSDWFKHQFRKYKEIPVYKDGQLSVKVSDEDAEKKVTVKKVVLKVA